MTDIEPILQRLGLSECCGPLVAEGFDTWETLVDIQETDLDSLNVKLGHRRRLQRAIAEWRGLPTDRPISALVKDVGGADPPKGEGLVQSSNSKDLASAASTEQAKRKYRRHPKSDENAPEKPPSAYVLFSNRVREEVRSESLSFTEIARLVGERWQKLDPSQKELFEQHAGALKDTYSTQLSEYKKTDAYKDYTQYLTDFKAKHNAHDSKRPKLELQHSSSLSGTSGGDPGDTASHGQGHMRGDSVGSSSVMSQMSGSATQHGASATAIGAPVGRRSSPLPHQAADRRLLGQLSSQSSVSEGYDSQETLSRTASLSLGGAQAGTPPPATMAYRQGRPDYIYGPAGQQWQPRQSSYEYTPGTTSNTSPGSIGPYAPTAAVSSEQWRDRGTEARSYFTGPVPPLRQQPSSSMQISQLVGSPPGPDPAPFGSLRTLPPLRQHTQNQANIPYGGFGGSSATSPAQQQPPRQTTEPLDFAHPGRTHDRLENEAADTLAALADRQRSADDKSRTPRSSHGRR